jgi:ABC-type phosphate transport system auxiliary subunit
VIPVPVRTIVVIVIVVIALLAAAFVALVRKLGESKALVGVACAEKAQTEARANAVERVAEQVTDVAEQAVRNTNTALERARTIEEVNGKLDGLIEHVTGVSQESQGRHALRPEHQEILDRLEKEFRQ